MQILVHLHTILQRKTPGGTVSKVTVSLHAHATITDLLQVLEIEYPSDALLFVINSRSANPDQVIQPGDVVHLIPAISGG